MTNYDQWKADTDPHGFDAAAIEARENAEFAEACRIKKLEMKSAALGWFADFARRIDGANWSELSDLERRVGRMPDLLLSYSREEIQF